MGALSPLHLVISLVVALIMFGGRGRLSSLMGDAAKGIKAFRDGLKEDIAPDAKTEPQPLALSRGQPDSTGT